MHACKVVNSADHGCRNSHQSLKWKLLKCTEESKYVTVSSMQQSAVCSLSWSSLPYLILFLCQPCTPQNHIDRNPDKTLHSTINIGWSPWNKRVKLNCFWGFRKQLVAMGLNICFSRFDGNALEDNRDDHTDRAKNNTEQPQLPTQGYSVCKGSKKLHYNYLEYDCCCQYTDEDPIF